MKKSLFVALVLAALSAAPTACNMWGGHRESCGLATETQNVTTSSQDVGNANVCREVTTYEKKMK